MVAMNWTNGTSNTTDSTSSLGAVVVLSIVNILSIIVGSWGNSLVVIAVICNRSLHSSTNVFIASLAAADLMVTAVCMPIFYVYNVLTWPVWPFGSAVCRISSYFVHMSVMASALSLLAISYDRFVAIWFPMKRIGNLPSAKVVVAVIWCVSPLLLLPSVLYHDVRDVAYRGKRLLMCVESWDTLEQVNKYQMYRISCYFLFVLQISVLYFNIGCKLYKREPPGVQTSSGKAKLNLEKRKIIKMLFLVVMLFTFCWLPYIINKLLNIFPPWAGYRSPDLFVFVGNLMGLLNSVANPFCYAALNKNFRTALKQAMRCKYNYDTEQRRRKVSAFSNKNQSVIDASARKLSESVFIDYRKTSMTSFLDGHSELPGGENTQGRIQGLSFASIESEYIALSSRRSSYNNNNTSITSTQNGGKRKVSFGPDMVQFADTGAIRRSRRISVELFENGSATRNLGIDRGKRVNSFSGIINRASVADLGPIEENLASLSTDKDVSVNYGYENHEDLLTDYEENVFTEINKNNNGI